MIGWLVGWFGLVWFGLVWFGLVWFGLVGLVGWLFGHSVGSALDHYEEIGKVFVLGKCA